MNEIEGGFVSTWRKMHEWEWYDDDAVFKVFIGFLWLANYKDQQWKGIIIKRGSFVTSIANLCTYFRKSKNTVLRCLECLKQTGEILDEVVPNKYRIITVVNYDKYQCVVQNLNNKKDNSRDNKRYNKRDNNKDNCRDNCKDNSRDTTNKYNKSNKGNNVSVALSGQTDTEKQQPSATSHSKCEPPAAQKKKELQWKEWRFYCESKGKSVYDADDEWRNRNGRFSEKVTAEIRRHNSEVGYDE